MGGIGDFLFGSSEDAKHVGNVETLLPGQKELLEQLTDLLGLQLGKGVKPYPGTITPDLTDTQQSAIDFVQNLLGGGNQPYNLGMESIGNLLKPYDPTAAKEYWTEAVYNPSIKNWEDVIVPGVMEKFAAIDALDSGASRRAIAKSGADLESNLGATLASTLFQDKSQGASNALNALNLLPGLISTPAQLGLGAGGVEYGVEAGKGQEDFQKWLGSQGYSNPWLQFLQTALGTEGFSPMVQGPTQKEGLLSTLGGGKGLASLIGLFM